jgi:hypothetical protein
MKKLILATLLFAHAIHAFSQDSIKECGTVATPEQIAYLSSFDYSENNLRRSGILYIPVLFHFIRNTDSTGGLTLEDADSILTNLNKLYINANMVFKPCSAVNFIDDSFFYDFDYYNEALLTPTYDMPDVLNIYFANTVSVGGTPVCGYAYLPPSSDHIFISNSCALNKSTVPHEVGHYFSLYHTHGKWGSTTDELVNGSNCLTAGDDICDTPADPNLSGMVDNLCFYTGTNLDPTGLPYDPRTDNIMSYSRKACRNRMSNGQYSRINYSALNQRTNLSCGNSCAVTVSAVKTSFCTGDSVLLTTSPSTGLSFQWRKNGTIIPGATEDSIYVKQGGAYTVHSSDTNSCNSVSNTVSLTENPSPVPPAVTLSGTTLTSSYTFGNQWMHNGADIFGATGMNHTALASGYYKTRVATGGCTSISDSVLVLLSGLSSTVEHLVKVFPNPATEKVYVRTDIPLKLEVKITDVRGALLHCSQINGAGVLEIGAGAFRGKGIYFLHLTSDRGYTVRKIVIN